MNAQSAAPARPVPSPTPGRLLVRSLCLVLAGSLLAGCQSFRRALGPRFDPRNVPAAELALQPAADAARLDPALLQPSTRRFTLGPGDVLDVEILGEPTSRATTTVGPDGRIYFYLLPGLRVEGLTVGETKVRLEQELGTLIRGEPKVSVSLRRVESKHVWLLGRLGSPGIYPLTRPVTLLEAISIAGGPAIQPVSLVESGSAATGATAGRADDFVDLRRSFVLRQGRMLPVDFHRLLREGDLGQNIYLEPDDFVYLPAFSSGEVSVIGSVATPQPVSSTRGLTLVGALAAAGGPLREAAVSHIAVVRGSLAEPKIAVVDYYQITQGLAPDVRLEPGDIVYVPQSALSTATRYLDLILNTFARTVGANEGARAVSRNTDAVGFSVPIGGP